MSKEQHSTEEIHALLKAQTGKLAWSELARHFARGQVYKLAPELDLVAVATAMVEDRSQEIETWLQTGQLALATDTDARHWQQHESLFWAVVVTPWVLVQEIAS